MNLLSSIRGSVTVRVVGADIPGTLDELTRRGIGILNCELRTELEAEITILRSYYRRVRKVCEKRGDVLRLVNQSGIYWTIKSMAKRPVLMAGLLIYLLASLYLPGRVLFVRVSGNTSVPTRLILEAAQDCGIGFGASRRAVRSEKMKNTLLDAVPQLQWAGVNTYGCVAEISVRERSRQESEAELSNFGHIIASRDGVITSANAIQGNLICAPGQAVSEGDILISGYTDCGLTIRAEQAQGEIFALTQRELTVITPDFCQAAWENCAEEKKISLLIGKKRINLWKDSGIWDTTCGRMYEEYYITLPGGFQLPFGWSVETYRFRDLERILLNPEDSKNLLRQVGESCLKTQMLSGTIRDSVLRFKEADGIIQLTGEYSCVEMIGIMQRLQIGEKNGENN